MSGRRHCVISVNKLLDQVLEGLPPEKTVLMRILISEVQVAELGRFLRIPPGFGELELEERKKLLLNDPEAMRRALEAAFERLRERGFHFSEAMGGLIALKHCYEAPS